MYTTNQSCQVRPYIDADFKGNPIYENWVTESCSVVTFRSEEVNTSVRADTSASQGRDSIDRAKMRVLMKPYSKVNYNAQVKLTSLPNDILNVERVEPRFDAFGKLDHFECILSRQ